MSKNKVLHFGQKMWGELISDVAPWSESLKCLLSSPLESLPAGELKDTPHVSSSRSSFLPVVSGHAGLLNQPFSQQTLPIALGSLTFSLKKLVLVTFPATPLLPAGLDDLFHLLPQAVSGRQGSGHPLFKSCYLCSVRHTWVPRSFLNGIPGAP